jgi:hypothetical protein
VPRELATVAVAVVVVGHFARMPPLVQLLVVMLLAVVEQLALAVVVLVAVVEQWLVVAVVANKQQD